MTGINKSEFQGRQDSLGENTGFFGMLFVVCWLDASLRIQRYVKDLFVCLFFNKIFMFLFVCLICIVGGMYINIMDENKSSFWKTILFYSLEMSLSCLSPNSICLFDSISVFIYVCWPLLHLFYFLVGLFVNQKAFHG